jgi:hypothetical protein
MASTTVTAGGMHDRVTARLLKAVRLLGVAVGLTVNLCVRQAISGYCGTQRCTRDYPSTATSFLFFPDHCSGLCHRTTSQRRHP